MISVIDKDMCCGCTACANACPSNSIKMIQDKEGFSYPIVDNLKCTNCNLCKNICPITNEMLKEEFSPLYFAVKNNENDIRFTSSSGGVFTAIATHILNNDGVVFGAGYNQEFLVEHICVDNVNDLGKLRGSKYLQSDIKDSFLEVKKHLISNKLVLFSGTPCQIAGLKHYLRKEYKNLYLQDVACHGVPPAKLFKEYINQVENKYQSKIIKFNFRDKVKGWKKYCVTIEFENGKTLTQQFIENSYMKAFLRNLNLRPSCYKCNFKGIKTYADITLADFWGIEHVLPEFDDDKGTSLILVHTPKGMQLFEAIKNSLSIIKVDKESAIAENLSIIKSSSFNKNRTKFLNEVYKRPIEKVVYKYTKPSFIARLKRRIKHLLKNKVRRK